MDKNKNQTLMVKIICVLLSFSLWLYITNVENPVRTYDVKKIPVELTNLDYIDNAKLSLVDGQKFTVDLKIEGAWGDVNKVKSSDFKLVADLSTYALKEGENIVPVQIVDYPQNVSIKNNGVTSIKINLEAITSKEVKIKSNIKVTYKQGIHEVNQILEPNTVNITGGRSAIDKISSAVIQGEITNVNENVNKTFDIIFLDSDGNEVKNVESDVKQANLSVSVTNGKSVPINLSMVGTLKDGYELEKYELSSTMVGITGSADVLANTSRIETESIDISTLTEDTDITVNLKIPNGITVQNQLKSIKVKFKINKKENVVEEESEKTTKSIVCAVKYEGLNEKLLIDTSTKEINVSISGTKEEVDKILSENMTVNVDLSQVDKDGTYNLKPKVSIVNGEKITIDTVEDVHVKIKNKE